MSTHVNILASTIALHTPMPLPLKFLEEKEETLSTKWLLRCA